MKTLHVETGRHLYGGAQQVLWLIRELNAGGNEAQLVCAAGSAVARAAENDGTPCVTLPCVGDVDLRFAWRLTRLIRERRPDLVHCHSRRGGDWLGGRAAARAGVPVVLSRRVDNREAPWLAARRYAPFDRIVAISDAVAGALRADGVDGGRITVIRSAVDAARFATPPDCAALRERFELAADDACVFCVAQFIARKGHRVLLEAVARLAPRYPRLKVLLFGRGPLEAELRSLATNLGLGGVVQFAGFRDDLDDYLGCATLLAHPALQEGLGVAALKASAAGVPVVAAAAGGLPEAVQHEKTGLIVPAGNVPALADAIAALLDDPARCGQLGAQGRARMQQEFSVATMADRHRTLYQAVLDERR